MSMQRVCFYQRLAALGHAARFPMLSMLVALLSWPADAGITLPTDPLTTASRVPPNILFILDDSGSMAFGELDNPEIPQICLRNMDGGACQTSNNAVTLDITDYSYVGNTIYYNPVTNYTPWTTANGGLMTGGTSYNAVYGDFNKASGSTIDLASSSSCAKFDRNGNDSNTGANITVCGGVQTFYVPKNTGNTSSSYLGNAANYYRYQISDAATITRGEFGSVNAGSGSPAGFPVSKISVPRNEWVYYSVNVPSYATSLVVTTSGGSGDVNLYVRKGGQPTLTTSNNCNSVNAGNSETCSLSNPVADTYQIGIYGLTAASNLTLSVSMSTNNSCSATAAAGSSTWINCTASIPSSRSVAAETTNYATWFSYHRTRIKSAKSGAGQAFSDLGANVRVGFRTIWSRNNLDIPVNDGNQGLFVDRAASGLALATNARTNWYSRLYNASGFNGTPLLDALQSAGKYFQNSSNTGPYGPETGTDQYACRQNFAILTTDGYWNGASTAKPGNQDGTNGVKYSGPNGTPAPYGYTAAPPFSDGYSNTLADVAMSFWKTDLRTDLDNLVPTNNADPAFWQHMVTFGIAIGARGVLDPDKDLPGLTSGTTSWPDPQTSYTGGNDILARVDDLWHATVNGHGTFLSASDPEAFKIGLTAALFTITQLTGSSSNVSATSTSLDSGTLIFKASYQSGIWTGELEAFPLINKMISNTAAWKASNGIPKSGRKIFTWNGSSKAGATFPTAAQTASLARSASPAVSGEDNAAYLAGDRSQEIQSGQGGNLRNRSSLLGDIVTSSPVYSSEIGMVFVGANDGMLHAFNAATGQEQFAYVPSAINFADLGSLSSPIYSHRYFVDGPVILSSRAQTPNKTVLVGALGKGGKGIFALDVTNPASFGSSNVKWERYGASGDSEANTIGLVQARPVIAKLNDGTMALIVANGINSASDQAVLLIYNLETGVLISQINTSAGSAITPNGLSGATGWDADANGTVDYVYAGDLLGNVWKFDLSSATKSDWKVANTGKPIFTASYPMGILSTAQPITANMTVAMNPNNYETWIFFGTGRFMTSGDITDKSVQTLYGIVDTSTATSSATLSRSALTSRSVQVTGTSSSGFAVRGFERNAVLPPGSKGWYINLLTPSGSGGSATAEGERIVSEAQLFNTTLVVSSVIPTSSACRPDGTGYINSLDAFTGTSNPQSFFDLDGDGSFADETVGNVPIGSVNLNVGMPTLANIQRGKLVVAGSSANLANPSIADSRTTGRVSWREIIRN